MLHVMTPFWMRKWHEFSSDSHLRPNLLPISLGGGQVNKTVTTYLTKENSLNSWWCNKPTLLHTGLSSAIRAV